MSQRTLKMTCHSDIGQKIRSVMESEGVTPVQLSKSLGVNRQRVNNIFKAKDLKWSTVLRICNALGVDTNRFAE